jgi:hypothetical protein
MSETGNSGLGVVLWFSCATGVLVEATTCTGVSQ